MARLSRLEKAFIQVTEVLVDHGERFDRIDRRLEGVNERLDRLIAVTVEERTFHYERLRDVERRLARLEERAGV